jgi:predicted phosphoribosyltransferase
MSKGLLIEDISLHDRIRVFKDRKQAGIYLAEKLLAYRGTDSIILSIPSGGVPVAREVAVLLHLPMDLIIVRKIQIPFNPEAGFGAMGPSGEIVFNDSLLKHLNLSKEEIERQTKKTADMLKKRENLFRSGQRFPSLKGKNVILIDDGLASGYTMYAAVRFIRKMNPLEKIIAVPTGSQKTVEFLLPQVDKIVCLNVRSGFPFAVAEAYEDWYDLSDEEVLAILGQG